MSERTFLSVVFCYLVMDIFAFSIILPWLPTILDAFAQEQDYLYHHMKSVIRQVELLFSVESNPKWDSVIIGGCITSAFSLSQCVSSTIAGTLSDMYSRKPLLVTLQVVSILVHLCIARWGSSFTWFVCFRLLCGATRANVAVLTALVSDHSSTSSRSRGMAVIGAAYSVGFTLGPLLSALTVSRLIDRSQQGRLLEFLGYGAALFNTVGLLFLYSKLPQVTSQHSPKRKVTKNLHSRALELLNFRKLFSFNGLTNSTVGDTCLWKLSAFWFTYLFLFSGLEFTLMFLARSRFGYTSQDQGRMFFFLGIVMAIVQGGLIRRFSFNQAHLGALSIVCLSASSLLLSVAKQTWLFYSGLILFAVASATFVPSFQAMVSLLTKQDCQGQALGLLRSLNALARAIGPAFLSLLFWSIGPTLYYANCGCGLLLLCIIYMRTDIPLSTKPTRSRN